MSAPVAFCTRCRALLDQKQRCGCEDEARLISLDEDAATRIEEALLIPSADEDDAVGLSIIAGLLPMSALYFVLYLGLRVVRPEASEAWPWIFALPFTLLSLGWIGLVLWSAFVARRARYSAIQHARHAPERDLEVGTLERGRLIAAEVHLRGDARLIVVRDALIEEPLVLRRPGQRIRVPAGRIDLFVAEDRWRSKGSTLTRSWHQLPKAIFAAGALRTSRSKPGERVALANGALEELGHDEASFRESATKELRWVPEHGRTTLLLG